jgi:hypothetical protein
MGTLILTDMGAVKRKILKTPRNVNAYLTKRYYDVTKPGSFTSVYKLYNCIKREGVYDIPLKKIKKWGMSQDAITMNKRPNYKGIVRRKVVSGLSWSMWDTDLLVLNQERITSANEGRGYILVCVDLLSLYLRAESIRTKSSKDVLQGFKTMFEKAGDIPRNVRSDEGGEYTNHLVKSYMAQKGVNLYHTSSSTKANYAESCIKQLKSRLFRLFQFRNSYKYIDVLQKLVDSYNNTYHSSLKMAPADINSENEQEIWFRKYFPPKDYKKGFKQALRHVRRKKVKSGETSEPFKYSVGAHVRISHLRDKFMRDYDIKYSGQVYTISSRRVSQGLPLYYLSDYRGEPIKGSFYEWEIQQIDFDSSKPFKIEKVLKTRGRKGAEESLVKYQFWPSSYNEWIPSKNIKSLKTS